MRQDKKQGGNSKSVLGLSESKTGSFSLGGTIAAVKKLRDVTWLSPSEQPTKHAHRQDTRLWPSKEMPRPGTIMRTRGWWVSADPHL
jgi:hypothetical protein